MSDSLTADILLEKYRYKKKIDPKTGKVIKQKINVDKKKPRSSAKTKAALKKARAKANTPAAKRARQKTMKKRKQKGI